jgi:hypothetical protein
MIEPRGSEVYKGEFNYLGKITVEGEDLGELLLRRGLVKLSLQAPKYLAIKEINFY